MYLEQYSKFKGHLILKDKFISSEPLNRWLVIESISIHIQYYLKTYKISVTLIYLVLVFITSNLSPQIWTDHNKYVCLITIQHNIFKFLQSLILIWAPLLNEQNIRFLVKNENLQFLNLTINLPVVMEIEKLIELNETVYGVLRKLSLMLLFKSKVVHFIHKESVARFLKLPLTVH